MKLGCNFNPNHPLLRLLPRLYNYASLVPAVESDWRPVVTDAGLKWGALGNLDAGDCVFAAVYHQLMVWLGATSDPTSFTKAQCLADYSRYTGYVLGDESTDLGTDPLEMLSKWRSIGMVEGKYFLDTFARVSTWSHLRATIDLCGGALVCINCPEAWLNTDKWSAESADGSSDAGGHCVFVVAQNADRVVGVSWGKEVQLTEDGWANYGTLGLAVMSKVFATSDGGTPDGIKYDALLADMPAL